MRDQEIQRLFPDVEGHQRPLTVEAPLARETVFAVQVAGMRDVQAECLHDVPGAFLERTGDVLISIRRIELPGFHKGFHVRDALADLFFRHVRAVFELLQDPADDFLFFMIRIERDDLVGDVIHRVDRAGAAVQDDIVSVQPILMYHGLRFLFALRQSNHRKSRPLARR